MDIISSLPDPILCHILSFLPIHFSATTSVVARRWRHLWTYVSDIYFNAVEYYESLSENKMDFLEMVDRVLSLHNGFIDSLVIRSDGEITSSQCQIDAWISTAIARKVQVLSLCDLSGVRLPQFCFKCDTLVKLSVTDCTISAEPRAVCLPRLKKLNLIYNFYENDESLPNFISGCSAIEDLFVDRYVCDNMICCYVSSPTLKSLVLWSELYVLDRVYEHKVVLDIPAVQYLELHDYFSQITLVEKLSSAVVAKISLSYDLDPEANISHWGNLFQLVEKLSDTKSLTFRCCGMMVDLNPTFSFATRFHNLTSLELEADWHFLTELLESAYKLQSLTIREVDELNGWREPKHLPECLSSSLKHVSICGYAGGEHELNMVKYILRHAKVLERIKIDMKSCRHSNGVDSKLNMLQQISYFPRGSTKCQLTLT